MFGKAVKLPGVPFSSFKKLVEVWLRCIAISDGDLFIKAIKIQLGIIRNN